MIRITDVTEENWLEVVGLSVKEEQKAFLAPAIGILARGYVYRNCNARVWVIENDEAVVGAALVREFDDEPLGYDLQQFMMSSAFRPALIMRRAMGERSIISSAHFTHSSSSSLSATTLFTMPICSASWAVY